MNVTINWWVGLPKELQKDIEFEECNNDIQKKSYQH